MGLGYRAVLNLSSGDDAVAILEEQFRSWLKSKRHRRGRRGGLNIDDWEGPGEFAAGPNATLTVVDANDTRDGSRRELLRLRETNQDGIFIVSATALSTAGRKPSQTIVVEIDVEGASEDDAIATARPPRLVSMLLERLDVMDSATPVYAKPQLASEADIDDVANAIFDRGRSVSVVVAADPGGVSIDRWAEVVADLTADSLGVSTTYIVPTTLLDRVNSVLPASHRIADGQIRTFAPDVDIENSSDGFRHRVLTPRGLLASFRQGSVGGRLPVIHAQRARQRLVQGELPADIRRGVDLLRRAESETARVAEIDRARKATAEAIEPARPADRILETLRSFFRRWIDVEEVDEQSVLKLDNAIATARLGQEVAARQIDNALSEQSRLAQEIEALRAQVEEAEFAARLELDEARKARYEASSLRARLADLHADATVPPEDNDWEPPSSIEDLVLKMSEGSGHPVAERVVFSGDLDTAIEVDKRDTFGRVAATLWEYVQVLYDFAGARQNEYAGSVHQYLTDDSVKTRRCSPNRHARGETAAVMQNRKMASERRFPVPKTVDRSGMVTMEAHFKTTQRDTYAPRMYYLDDTGNSGKVYIGYIGPHLTNMQTRSA